VIERAARAYIAGPELDDALKIACGLHTRGYSAAIGYWDAANEAPRGVADAYLQAISCMAGGTLDCYVSIKLPALDYSRDLLEEVLASAMSANVRVHFDSLGPETVDRSFALIDRVVPHYSNLSVTLPGRWHRSLRDAVWARERNLPIRIVKGQWADESGLDPDAGFLALVKSLAGNIPRLAVASHNPTLARECFKSLERAGTQGEMELLHGLPSQAVLATAREMNLPVRVYVPYGHAWLPYCISQAQKNPTILWRTLKDAVFGGDVLVDPR
jgi:proline dehydrogenase